METNMSEVPINQKEYLKKYLAIGKAPGEKKKKKKKIATKNRVQIIDDDADANSPNITIQDPIVIDEDAPQIVAIIDERPPSLRVDEKTKNPLWRPIGTVSDYGGNETKQIIKSFKIGAPKDKKGERQEIKEERCSESPTLGSATRPRPIKDEIDNDCSSPRQRQEQDQSPLRRRDDDISPPRRNKTDDDISPPRKTRRDDDKSPPRRNRRDDDISPPRRQRRDRDASPPRRKRKDSDTSPRRKRTEDPSLSNRNRRESSPSRRSRPSRFSDRSPPKARPLTPPPQKMKKTLDGKSAGLQNARELIEETRSHHNREENLFKSLEKEVSGENAETVFRDRKSGRVRNIEEEENTKRKKREEEEKNKEKYERWGRGLAQVENRELRIQEELHEMSKPLARYADDEDLERYLKEQEREGDPMLAYIRKKKRKTAVEKGEVIKPQFEGEFMPNRYGIRPGHRWDGVDRSNGYEKKWFEVQNAKKALLEESYKWSTEDM